MSIIDLTNWIARSHALRPVGLLIRGTLSRKSTAQIVAKAGRRIGVPIYGACLSQLTGTSVKQNLTDGYTMFKTVEAFITTLKPDLAICTFLDLTAEAEACGCNIIMPENALPSISDHLIQSPRDIKELKIPNPHKDGRLNVFIEATKLFSKRFTFLKIATSAGPFTIAAQLMGIDIIARKIIKEPTFVHNVMDYALQVSKRYNAELIKAGADIIGIFEMACSLLSAKIFEKSVLPFLQSLVMSLNCPAFLHICGHTDHLLEQMCKTGVVGISVDSYTDITKIKHRVTPDIVIIGNLSPVEILMEKRPDEIRKVSTELLRNMNGVPNFVLASGCDLPVETPIENIKAMIDAIKDFI